MHIGEAVLLSSVLALMQLVPATHSMSLLARCLSDSTSVQGSPAFCFGVTRLPSEHAATNPYEVAAQCPAFALRLGAALHTLAFHSAMQAAMPAGFYVTRAGLTSYARLISRPLTAGLLPVVAEPYDG